MIRCDHTQQLLVKALHLPVEEIDYALELLDKYSYGSPIKVSKVLQRISVDEHLSDAGKLYAIFTFGRRFERQHEERSR